MRITITTLMFLCWGAFTYGQTIEPSTLISHANYHKNNEGVSLHASFGEVATEFITADNLSISQGFLQTYFQLVPVENNPIVELEIKIGPIPCTTYFDIEKNTEVDLTAFLFNTEGRIINTTTLVNKRTTIEMSTLPAGNYFLLIKNGETPVFKSFKVIKS